MLSRLAHRVAPHVPTAAKRHGIELARSLPRLEERLRPGGGPLVTVVVTVTDTQVDFIDDQLDSVRAQHHRNLQVLVVPYGPAAEATRVAARHARDDWRVRVLRPARPTLGSARNAGAALARGRYLCFAGGADLLPPAGLHLLVQALEESGSDFAFGRLGQPTSSTRAVRSAQMRVHRRPRRGIGVSDFPEAITDVRIENRLFRTDFWVGSELAFAEADGSVLTLTTVRSFLTSGQFDVLSEVTYRWMSRGEGVPFGHLSNALPALAEWLSAQGATQRALESAHEPGVRDAWLFGVLDQDALAFLDDAERATPAQWQMLHEGLRDLYRAADETVLSRVRAESRLKCWLAAHDRRAQLEELVASRWFTDGNVATLVEDGRVYAELPFFRDPAAGVPDECFVLAESETPLNASLSRSRWVDGDLELEIFAHLEMVGLTATTPRITAHLVQLSTGEELALTVTPRPHPAATVFGGRRFQNYDNGSFTVRLDVAALADRAASRVLNADEDLWTLRITMAVEGLERSGQLTHLDLQGSALDPEARQVGWRRVGLRGGAAGPFHVVVSRSEVILHSGRVEGRVVSGTVLARQPGWPTLSALLLGRPAVSVPITWVGEEGRFELRLPDVAFTNRTDEPRKWRLQVERGEERVPVAWSPTDGPWLPDRPSADLALHGTALGTAELRELRFTPAIGSVQLSGDSLVVEGEWFGQAPKDWSLDLVGTKVSVPGTRSDVEDERRFRVVFQLEHSRWKGEPRPLQADIYRFWLTVGNGPGAHATEQIQVLEGMRRACPVEVLGAHHRVRAFRTVHGRVAIKLSVPLTTQEHGPFAQQQLQTWFRSCTEPIDAHAVYLQSYAGQSATDSQLAIHELLRRVRPDLTLYWGVSDYASAVPEGGVPVLMRSRRWYEVLATSRYLINNIDFDRWFAKRPGQVLLQTFHGYPSKSMGIQLWEAKQFTPRRIALELERTSVDWDLILTPAPEMDQYYRTEYRYDGAIHNQGYPRDDVLVGDRAEAIRRTTRERLNIRPGQTAVLYAPTWRDHLAVNYRSAPLVRHLDLERASAALGEDYILLMRGHRFHARGASRPPESARVLDVTDYPEINDLILAADVAVLDYSSLRFDFAQTGKPMLFLVPDLHMYDGGVRGFLYDYRSTAPGPLLQTADQVVEALVDLEATAAAHREDLARFNERFNYWQDGRATERVVEAFFGGPETAK